MSSPFRNALHRLLCAPDPETMPPARPSPPTVVAPSGVAIRGKAHPASAQYPRAVDAFYGVPYARVPRRFRAAVPVSPASLCPRGFDAGTPGQGAQPAYGAAAADAEAEKTLTLNVFRPATSEKKGKEEEGRKGLPVVVYVHGGGFNFGEPLERDHVAFVSWSERGVLVVSICYRLGVLGFTPGGEGREANLGLKDQRLALEWVKAHIGLFGGDGGNVTFMGVSAGAHSIGHHMLDPRGGRPRLFRKAILESGAPTARSVWSAGHPRTRAQLASLQGYVPPGKALETLDIEGVLRANVAVWAENAAAVTWPFQPVVEEDGKEEDKVIPATPLELWARFAERMAREEEGLAVVTGFCSHEGVSFVQEARADTNADFRAFFDALIPGFTDNDLDELEALYPDPVSDPASPYRNSEACVGRGAQFTRMSAAYAHYAYICPVLHTAHTLSRISSTLPNKDCIKVYVYEYAALSGAAPPAANHGDQASVVAHDPLQLYGRPGLGKVAEAMHSRWTAFAAGGLEGAMWPRFETPLGEGGEGRMLVFGEGNTERVTGGGAGEEGVGVRERRVSEQEMRQCEFWWARMGLSQGMGERREGEGR